MERAQCFYLWPENVAAWVFFLACRTQWRHGFDGPTGLVWEAVQLRMDRLVPRRRHRKLWQLLEAAEAGYLQGLAERREQAEQERGRLTHDA